MEIIALALGWYFVGWVGVCLMGEFGLRRDGLDVTAGDLLLGAVFAACGPFALASAGLVLFLTWCTSMDRVVLPRK